MNIQAKESEALLSHVLIVEDNDQVARFLTELLSSSGYRVTVRPDGEAALVLFNEDPKQFDIVITDQIMPRLTGVEMARHLMKINPEQRIILLTGFFTLVNMQNIKKLGIKKYLAKPVNPAQLLDTVNELVTEKIACF